jgi:hypothetical protein
VNLSPLPDTPDKVGERSFFIKEPFKGRSWSGAIGILLSVMPVALGEEPSPAPSETAENERVIVTGSNIPTAGEVGPNPVQTIDRDTIDKSGERTTEELIRIAP